jgi:hypothetical protein
MSSRDFVQLGLYLLALVVATPVLGAFMARTFQDRPTLLSPTGSLTSASERRCAHAGKVVTSQDRQKPERVGEIAAKAVVQPARKAAGGSRGTARCGVAQQRGVNHRACNRQLGLVFLQLRILNGVVLLLTTEVHNKALAQYLIQQRGAIGSLDLTTATLEVLACIA